MKYEPKIWPYFLVKDHEATYMYIHCYCKHSVLSIGYYIQLGLGLRLDNIRHEWACYILRDFLYEETTAYTCIIALPP